MSSLATVISSVFQQIIGDAAEEEIVQFIADAYQTAHDKAQNNEQQFLSHFISEVNDVMGDATNQFATTLFQRINPPTATNIPVQEEEQINQLESSMAVVDEQPKAAPSAGVQSPVSAASSNPSTVTPRVVSLRSSSRVASKALDTPLQSSKHSNKSNVASSSLSMSISTSTSTASPSSSSSLSSAMSSQPSVPPPKAKKNSNSSVVDSVGGASSSTDSKKRRVVSLNRSSTVHVPESLNETLESGKKELRKKKFQKHPDNTEDTVKSQNSQQHHDSQPPKRRRQFGNGFTTDNNNDDDYVHTDINSDTMHIEQSGQPARPAADRRSLRVHKVTKQKSDVNNNSALKDKDNEDHARIHVVKQSEQTVSHAVAPKREAAAAASPSVNQPTTPGSPPLQSAASTAAPTAGGIPGVAGVLGVAGAGSKTRCLFFPNCTKANCPFYHPSPSDPCQFFPNCQFGNKCLKFHPIIACKFGAMCTNPSCNYFHALPPSGRPTNIAPHIPVAAASTPCRYGAACKNAACAFVHPPTRQIPSAVSVSGSGSGSSQVACRYDPNCLNPACTFYHPSRDANAANALTDSLPQTPPPSVPSA